MRIGKLIWAWRHARELAGLKDAGIRAVSRDIGISHATLSRIERGEACDSDTLAKIMVWVFAPEEPIKGKNHA